MALMGQVSLITVNRPPARECASVRGDDEDKRSNDDTKDPEESIDCELATTESFTFSICSGTQFICWPSVTEVRRVFERVC